VLVQAIGGRVDLGWKIVAQEQEVHGCLATQCNRLARLNDAALASGGPGIISA
jgi:hypothetical protein